MGYRVISKDQTTKEIIDNAAAKFMQEKGADFSIRELCAAAGISLGTFYIYYKSKDELVLERLKYNDDFIYSATKESEGEAPEVRIGKVMKAYMDYVSQRGITSVSNVYRCMLATQSTREHTHTRALFQCFNKIIEEGQEKGVFNRKHSAEEYAEMLIMACRGLAIEFCYYNEESTELYQREAVTLESMLSGMKN